MTPFTERQISQFDRLGTKDVDIVFLGDSLIAEGKWDELFSTPILNRGIPGDTVETLAARVEQVSKGQPKKVFLMVGINDIVMRKSEDEIASGITRIVEKIGQDSPKTEIFVFSILPNKIQYKERIESLNTLVEKAISDRATWVNLYPYFVDETSWRT
jgi:lysophospholipase L1-like esterase